MEEPRFPLEILEKFAAHLDGSYSAQAAMCLVSRPLFTFTRPRLYKTFSSFLTGQENHARYLRTIVDNPHLAELVHTYAFVALPTVTWTRDLYATLPSMSNLTDLTLINRFPRERPHPLDIWRDFFQSDRISFQLTSLRLFWVGLDPQAKLFETLSLSGFLKHQKALERLTLYHNATIIGSCDCLNLRDVTIDWCNWGSILPDRTIHSLQVDGPFGDAREYVKPIAPGSPIHTTLGNVKVLRMHAEIMNTFFLSFLLSSLEVLISEGYEDKWRTSISVLPHLKVLCIPGPKGKSQKRKETADWFFSNIGSLTDVVFSSPNDERGRPKNCCERYRRRSKAPEIMPRADSYKDLIPSYKNPTA
ncbi:hypothetical protein P691DRAFT_808199 [Macrolepiota fuliginosa MF-IS2]|uniref:Uncharacterized protein n=1 Tax=Macrolepiota fuliginosa MF-IS2 TaxID=1400762 RepID=A0A9P6BZY0_9AGAR|nr:hypothetical protein P691DRAFT_808199 [Macrolepiota fuliginosa MF-IS2]